MDRQNTITFHAATPQPEIANGQNLFLWDNYGSPFDDFFVNKPPTVQTEEVTGTSASTSLQLLSSSPWDFSLPGFGSSLDLSANKATGVAFVADDYENNDFRNGPMSVFQNHPSFQSVQNAGTMLASSVNKNNTGTGNMHLQPTMLHPRGKQGANEKLNDSYLWKIYRDGNRHQQKCVSKVKYSQQYSDKKLKQIAVLTKENARLQYENKMYQEEIKRLQAMERKVEEEVRSLSK